MITGPGSSAEGEEIMITHEGHTTRVTMDVYPDRVDMIVSANSESVVIKMTAHDADRWASSLAIVADQAKSAGSADTN